MHLNFAFYEISDSYYFWKDEKFGHFQIFLPCKHNEKKENKNVCTCSVTALLPIPSSSRSSSEPTGQTQRLGKK